ncbi:hypothetical protein D3C85_1091030 [compost metagenome]
MLQPGEGFLGGEATVGQGEQVEEGLDQRDFRAQAAVGQAEGNPRGGHPWGGGPGSAAFGGENRLDIGRVTFDIRGQHHHLIRGQLGIGGEAGEQLVMQDFHLAQRRVGDMQLQRAVVLAQDQALVGLAGAQAQDVVLQRLQQAAVVQIRVFGIQADFLAAFARSQGEQAVEKVAALFAQTGQ